MPIPIPVSKDLNSDYIIRKLQLNDILEGNYLSILSELTTIWPNPDNSKVLLSEDEKKTLLTLRFQSLNPQTQHIFILCDKRINKVIGSATILLEDKFIHACGRVAHIEDVVISKEARGGGLGKQLVEYLLEFAKMCGCYKTILDCDAKNVAFYQKCGMKEKGFQMALYYED